MGLVGALPGVASSVICRSALRCDGQRSLRYLTDDATLA